MVIFLFLKINISIKFCRNSETRQFAIRVSLLKGLLKITFPFTTKDHKVFKVMVKFLKKFKIIHIKKEQKKKEDTFSFSKIKSTIEMIYEQYATFKQVFSKVRNYLKSRLVCNQLTFHLDFGLGDAALTGVSSGIVWGTVYNMVAIINSSCILKKTDINIHPDFNESKANIDLCCIFTFRIVHIIIIFGIFLFSYFKLLLNNNISIMKEKVV